MLKRARKRPAVSMLGDTRAASIGRSRRSDLTWQGMLGARYDWSEHWGVSAVTAPSPSTATPASRHLYGPQVGVVFRY